MTQANQRQQRRLALAAEAEGFLTSFKLPTRLLQPETVVAHLGPTNSGKSYDALELLAAVGAGVYAAPLRLLAREGYEKLVARLGPETVGLVTGQEVVNPTAPIRCCTTELAPLRGEVLVLDEVHWLDDPDRGWAWGRLLAAAEYRHMRLVGAANTEPVLQAAFGEALEIRRHRRLVPLHWAGPVTTAEVPPGSLIVAFSRKAVLALARDISNATAMRVGVLYGALPPAARRDQIEGFLDGTLNALCVTDVIGHGINLPARSVVLAETSKFDGQRRRPLHLWELAQIVGRAGRFGLSEYGEARVLRGVVGLEANATLARQAVEAAGGERSPGPSLLYGTIRPTLSDLGSSTGAELVGAVDRWQFGAGAALGGHPWLRAASLAPVSAALHRLAVEGLTSRLSVADLWHLATLPVEDPSWVPEVARAVVEPHRRLRVAPREDAERWSLEEAERAASRARGLASLAQAFPGVGGLEVEELLAVEAAAARRITAVLDHGIATAPFGRCQNCARTCPPYGELCDRCRGGTRPPLKKGYRGPRR